MLELALPTLSKGGSWIVPKCIEVRDTLEGPEYLAKLVVEYIYRLLDHVDVHLYGVRSITCKHMQAGWSSALQGADHGVFGSAMTAAEDSPASATRKHG